MRTAMRLPVTFPNFVKQFEDCPTIEVQASQEDVRRYLRRYFQDGEVSHVGRCAEKRCLAG